MDITLNDNGNHVTADLDTLKAAFEVLHPSIVFPAYLHRKAEDADGESSVTFKVPSTSLAEMAQLSALHGTSLEITVRVRAQQSRLPFGKATDDESEDEE